MRKKVIQYSFYFNVKIIRFFCRTLCNKILIFTLISAFNKVKINNFKEFQNEST